MGEILKEIKSRLQALYGDRLKGLILYGSEARGDAAEDSDIDIIALLEGPVSTWNEINATVSATRDVDVPGECYRPVMIIPVDEKKFNDGDCGFFREVKREGVMI